MIALALDRLDARRHTFGLLLEHLVAALLEEAPDLDLVLIRGRRGTDVRVPGARESVIPGWLERNAVYSRAGAAWMARQGARVVHFPFLYAPASWVGARVRRVVTIHGASRAALGDDLVSRFSEADLVRTRKRLRAFDRVITVSESSKQEIVEHYGVPREKITVVYNGVGDGFSPDRDPSGTLEKYGIRKPYLLTVSTLKPKKNVVASVRAFARLRQRHPDLPHQLVLVGYKAAGYTEVEETARQLGVENLVVQTGWTESAEIPDFYAGADLVLFPSLHEGFGLPIVEAMASGCPVVASHVYSIPEVGGNAILTFDPNNTDALCDGAEIALFDARERSRLVAAGFERAKQFTWTESARQTAAIYRELLGQQ